MELQLISRDKLKVVLSGKDLSGYSLSCDTIDYDNTETRRAFWDIFDTAKRETGFDAASERIYIQVYPNNDGGCDMYVTKLHKNDIREGKEACVSVKEKTDRRTVYVFDRLSDMICACRAVKNEYRGKSDAYCDESNFYLVLYPGDEDAPAAELPAMCEFGNTLCAENFEIYAPEHCTLLRISDAVNEFSAL